MKAVVFGIHGQDGYYLNNILQKNNVQVIGVSRSEGNWVRGDVSNRTFVEELIRNHQPDYVFHLAANSTTRHDALFENHETISTGTLNILEAVYRYSPGTKVFLSGSAMQFENKGLPIDEQTPLSASSPYAVARIQSVYAGR
ncbi:MAG TPA: NAD-dependent epimerase/dehydratase family protein, partial [Bacteroidales bacterium]|nr:NAD-dependent epimerase/dehydratase family protein [Bacteroidales bacterium]